MQACRRVCFPQNHRIISLPGSQDTVRGFSGVRLLIVDETARVANDLYPAVRPMLAVSSGRLLALSTPFGTRGWWYDAWHSTSHGSDTKSRPRSAHGSRPPFSRKSGERWAPGGSPRNTSASFRTARLKHSGVKKSNARSASKSTNGRFDRDPRLQSSHLQGRALPSGHTPKPSPSKEIPPMTTNNAIAESSTTSPLTSFSLKAPFR